MKLSTIVLSDRTYTLAPCDKTSRLTKNALTLIYTDNRIPEAFNFLQDFLERGFSFKVIQKLGLVEKSSFLNSLLFIWSKIFQMYVWVSGWRGSLLRVCPCIGQLLDHRDFTRPLSSGRQPGLLPCEGRSMGRSVGRPAGRPALVCRARNECPASQLSQPNAVTSRMVSRSALSSH